MKMVLSDLDGTLLKKGETALSLETFDMIHMLAQRGKLFAVASGRTYHELHTLFAPVAEIMLFVCLDGALVVRGGETLFSTPVPPEISVQLWRQSMEKEEGVFCCCVARTGRIFGQRRHQWQERYGTNMAAMRCRLTIRRKLTNRSTSSCIGARRLRRI